MPEVAAVLFDFGGVIIEGPFARLSELARSAGVPADAVRQINSRNPDGNAWARVERNEIGAEEFVAAFTSEALELGFQLPAQEIVDILNSMSPRRAATYPAMLDAIAACRAAGLKVALITNNHASLHDDPDATWLFDEFDAVVESSVVGSRKPEPAIYRLALDALGVTADRAVMLDDLGINLKTARALGMTTIKVVDPVVAAAELRALVGV